MFWWQQRGDGIGRAVTDRHGGVSTGPFGSLNLGAGVGDDPQAVAANRHTVAAAIGVPPERLVFMNQCHGARVQVLTGPWPGPPPECDAVVTSAPQLALAALAADCVPVLLADATAGVIGAVHAGRAGLLAGVVPAAVTAMTELGAAPERVHAVVGPCVCGPCYEVPQAMCDEVVEAVPQTLARSRQGTPALDLGAGVVAQLTAAGVSVHRLAGCTREDADLYSHRGAAGGPTGRFAGIVLRYAGSVPDSGSVSDAVSRSDAPPTGGR